MKSGSLEVTWDRLLIYYAVRLRSNDTIGVSNYYILRIDNNIILIAKNISYSTLIELTLPKC